MVAIAHELHGWRRGMRWVVRGVLGLVALIVVAVVVAIGLVHTDLGREKIRGIGNDELAKLFTGGGSIGRVEGSPFGELVLRDVVINGPDHKPAITAKTVRVSVAMFNLVKHHIELTEVTAEDVDVLVKREVDGTFAFQKLLAPQPNNKSSWDVDLDDIHVVRAHVMVDTGQPDFGVVNLDDVVIGANAHIHTSGANTAGVRIAATWRERKAPISIIAVVRDDLESTTAKHVEVSVGGVSLAASDIRIVKGETKIAGKIVIAAPAAAVAKLVPWLELPGDVGVTIEAGAAQGALIPVTLSGHVGAASVRATLEADPKAKRVAGTLTTNELDVSALTKGRLIATGAISATFDVTAGAAGELPTATAAITGHGTYQTFPRAELTVELASKGQLVTTTIAVTGPMQAKIEAALTRVGAAFHLDKAHVVASADPAAVTRGVAPVHGRISLTLDASGPLFPTPDLAVNARVDGNRARFQDLSVASLAIRIDATHLPSQLHGTASAKLTDAVRGDIQLGMLSVDARVRNDGKIAVDVRSRPKQDPWLIELAALVTPPGKGDTVTVDLGHYRVRAGNGTDWIGDGGRLVIDPRQFSLEGFSTRSRDGEVAVSGTMNRTDGHLVAQLDVERLALAVLGPTYRGQIAGHAAITRTGGRFAGTVDLTGTGIAIEPRQPLVDVTARIAAKPGNVTLSGTVGSAALGHAKVALDLAAPRDLTDIGAWKHVGRDAIHNATVNLTGIDLAQVASLLARPVDLAVLWPGQLRVLRNLYALTRPGDAIPAPVAKPAMSGTLDGELTLTATTAKGDFKVQKLRVAQLQGLSPIDAELVIDQPTSNQVVPTLTIKAKDIGIVTGRAELTLPANVLDLAAWRREGLRLVHSATLRTTEVAFDPAMLERLGIQSSLRGRASIAVDVGANLETVKVTANVTDLRGAPIEQPLSLHFEADLNGKLTNANLVVKTQNGALTLLGLHLVIPLTIDELRRDPLAFKTAALDATLELEQTSAPALLAVFGRNEVIGGTLSGKATATGTIAHLEITAHFVADLRAQPGARGRATPILRQFVLDATYDEGGGKLTLAGSESSGGTLNITAAFDLHHLAAGSATVEAHQFDLKPVLAFAPDPGNFAKGIVDANLAIKGFDPRTMQIGGELHLRNARMPIAPSVGTVQQANVDLVFTDKQIQVAATGKLGKGTLKLDGTIALDGASLSDGTATLILHHVSPIGATEPEIDAQITTKISRKDERWTADVTIDKGFVKVGKTGEALKPVGAPPDLHIGLTKVKPHRAAAKGDGPNAAPGPRNPGLVAHITIHPVKVEAEEFRTTVHGTLDVTTDASSLGVVGSIQATSGDLDLFDRRYRIEQASINFDGTVDPNLDIRIVHDFPDVMTVTLVRGRLSKPELVLTSDPGLYSQAELLGFLLGGEPNGDPQSGSARDRAAQIGSSLIANRIGGYVKKALPFDIDVIRYEAASATSSAAITVGSWVTHTLFFSVTQRLNPLPDENNNVGTLEYWFTRRLELELTAGDRNFDGIDLLWRKRY